MEGCGVESTVLVQYVPYTHPLYVRAVGADVEEALPAVAAGRS